MACEEHEVDWQLRYNELLLASDKALKAKERELSGIVGMVSVCAAALFALWLIHEDTWTDRLARAQGYCLAPLSDGGCAAWDKSALAAEWMRQGR